MLKLGVIAGEDSGDNLGAALIQSLRKRVPDLRVYGVAGPKMRAAGCESWIPSSELSVMGVFEVLGHLPRLLRLRRQLVARFIANPPDVFIGIDSPDFNLGVERRLRDAGIRTMHYVSPSVWAWREKRVKTVARSVDEVLCLFPFEKAFYDDHGVKARFVGHPLADTLPMVSDRGEARARLALADESTIVALLPGSRMAEVARLGPDFSRAAALIHKQRPEWQFIAPMASDSVKKQFSGHLAQHAGNAAVTLLDGDAHTAMAAADAILLASGTATLEAALIKRPMVVAYRIAPLTSALFRVLGLLNVNRFSLPNLIAGEALVPELLQEQATPEALAGSVIDQVESQKGVDALQRKYTSMHESLRQNASEQAAQAVLAIAGRTDD